MPANSKGPAERFTASLSELTGGRFELGIGAGRPAIEDELREKGLPVAPPGLRLDAVRDAVRLLRDLDARAGISSTVRRSLDSP